MSNIKLIIIVVAVLGGGLIGVGYFYTTYNVRQTAIVAPTNDQAEKADAQASKNYDQAWGIKPKNSGSNQSAQ